MTTTNLTEDELEVLAGVKDGADVWGYRDARLLRSVQAKRPELIEIVPAMERPPGHMRQPYFGCIATEAGRQALKAASSC